jgi:RND superfamily putative drug exporter
VRQIGTGLSLGILLDTFVVRTLLVPSAVVLLGRWNWWPSRLFTVGLGGPQPVDGPPPVLAAPAGPGP